jgi:hypothetical protein
VDPVANPYNPGAGSRPSHLVGCDGEIAAMDVALKRLRRGTNGRSQLLTGLQGVGKTVLLNELEDLAVGRGFFMSTSRCQKTGPSLPSWRRRCGARCWPWWPKAH